MFESKYNKLLTIILVIVVIAIVGLLVWWGFEIFQSNSISEETAEFVNGYQGDDVVPDDEVTDNENKNENVSNPLNEIEETKTGNGSVTTTKKTYKGYIVNGTMEIPKTNFKYPVLEEVSKKSIETSVAILYGAGLNQPGNTVIIGHNYRNGLFFSNNKKLNNGDKIYITDYTGKKMTYTIYNKFETTPEDTSFYQRDTNGNPEITLSTCTDDSSARLIIFAKAEQ